MINCWISLFTWALGRAKEPLSLSLPLPLIMPFPTSFAGTRSLANPIGCRTRTWHSHIILILILPSVAMQHTNIKLYVQFNSELESRTTAGRAFRSYGHAFVQSPLA